MHVHLALSCCSSIILRSIQPWLTHSNLSLEPCTRHSCIHFSPLTVSLFDFWQILRIMSNSFCGSWRSVESKGKCKRKSFKLNDKSTSRGLILAFWVICLRIYENISGYVHFSDIFGGVEECARECTACLTCSQRWVKEKE